MFKDMADGIPFSERKASTMTVVVQISEVNPETAFWLLPWTYVESYKKTKKKCSEGVEYHEPGTICSIASSCPGRKILRVRGMNKTGKAFQHATTIAMSIGRKFLSLKMSKGKIQICGVTHLDDIQLSIQLIFQHLQRIKQYMDTFKSSDREYYLQRVQEHCQGNPTMRKVQTHYSDSGPIELTVNRLVPDHEIRAVNLNEISDSLLQFLLSYARDFTYFSDYMLMLRKFHLLPDIFVEPLTVLDHEIVMCNYNYNLGYKVNKDVLKSCFNRRDGFMARQNKATSDCVTIELPYTPGRTIVKRKRNKIPHHTFIVYGTGSVTQSGPFGKISEMAHESFMSIIKRFEDEIKIT